MGAGAGVGDGGSPDVRAPPPRAAHLLRGQPAGRGAGGGRAPHRPRAREHRKAHAPIQPPGRPRLPGALTFAEMFCKTKFKKLLVS